MLSDVLGVPFVYDFVYGEDRGQAVIEALEGYRRNTILVRHLGMAPEELFQHTERLGFRVVFLYRDPRDVIASSVNMRKHHEGFRPGMPPFPKMSMQEILDWELETYGRLYSVELPEWVEFDHPSLLKVKYEDVSVDAVAELRRITRFLGLRVRERGLARCARGHAFGVQEKRPRGEEDKTAHNRKGIIGDHKNQFSPDQLRRLDHLLSGALARMGYLS